MRYLLTLTTSCDLYERAVLVDSRTLFLQNIYTSTAGPGGSIISRLIEGFALRLMVVMNVLIWHVF